jgi:hypothetical protein
VYWFKTLSERQLFESHITQYLGLPQRREDAWGMGVYLHVFLTLTLNVGRLSASWSLCGKLGEPTVGLRVVAKGESSKPAESQTPVFHKVDWLI